MKAFNKFDINNAMYIDCFDVPPNSYEELNQEYQKIEQLYDKETNPKKKRELFSRMDELAIALESYLP